MNEADLGIRESTPPLYMVGALQPAVLPDAPAAPLRARETSKRVRSGGERKAVPLWEHAQAHMMKCLGQTRLGEI